ncbi:hypothetical protein GH714_009310 [Hevea brasiliensis]|uniref:Increased DNA methylation 1 C-terminal domain-containing protein n=1 Tax=Hevea brasiliensis TaxID=3981 RepID=A0A6A6KVL7_HEVBR|nr:hypothetical protein GH714_009310 [Hevea brasiliensis]
MENINQYMLGNMSIWSKLRRLNFHGFYAIVLHRGDEIVSVATVRIHGLKAAEMPLVATPFQYRRQGMCRLLLHELLKGTIMQKVLSSSGLANETKGTCQDSKESSSSICLEHNYGANIESRFCGLFYRRKEKAKIIGKENMVNGCNGNMQMYAQVYKRRRILGCRE